MSGLLNRLEQMIQNYEQAATLVQEYERGHLSEDMLEDEFEKLHAKRKAVERHNQAFINEQRRLFLLDKGRSSRSGINDGDNDDEGDGESLGDEDDEEEEEDEDEDDASLSSFIVREDEEEQEEEVEAEDEEEEGAGACSAGAGIMIVEDAADEDTRLPPMRDSSRSADRVAKRRWKKDADAGAGDRVVKRQK